MRKLLLAIRRERRQKLLASAVLLLVGLLLGYFFFGRSIILSMAGLAGTVLGLQFMIRFAGRRRTEDLRLVRLLRHHPRRIVWVYAMVTERLPFGFQFSKSGILYFKLVDGDDISVSLPAQDCRLVSRFLNRLLPHATFGYSRDREQWYLADPRMLLRRKEGD